MKLIKNTFLICCILLFAQIGFAKDRIGVVDIQKIVNNSTEVKILKQQHNARLEELNKIILNAQSAIANETDAQKIVILQDKYNNEFNLKKNNIDNQYTTRLNCIEEKLRAEIAASARKNNYDLVFAKNNVFYGGDDITDLILKDIK